jgi:hypothetical protein
MLSIITHILCILAMFSATAQAHGVVTEVKGANGVTAAGFGVLASTPRDGTRRNPFQVSEA